MNSLRIPEFLEPKAAAYDHWECTNSIVTDKEQIYWRNAKLVTNFLIYSIKKSVS